MRVYHLELQVWTREILDRRLNVSYPSWIPVRHYDIHTKTALDFSSTSNYYIMKLTDFPAQAGIRKLWIFGIDTGAQTTYNDAQACQFLGRHGDFNVKIKRVGDSKELSLNSAELMRQYAQETYRMEFGRPMPTELLLETGLADTYHGLFTCCIDFVGIDCLENQIVMGGTDSTVTTTQYEITVYPTTALSSNVTLYGAVERIVPWKIDQKTHTPIEIKSY
jgi:hypothetical protein